MKTKVLTPLADFEVQNKNEEFVEELDQKLTKSPEELNAYLNECFRRLLEDLKPRLADGVPELGLPPLDPLDLDKLEFVHNKKGIAIKSFFTELKLHGMRHFSKAEFKVNSVERIINFELAVPRVKIDGNYIVDGKIFLFPVVGNGPFWFDVEDVEGTGYLNLKKVKRNDSFVAVIDSIGELDLNVKKIKVEMKNLFNGNRVLGPVANKFLNEVSLRLFQKIKPEILKIIADILKAIADAIVPNLQDLAEELTGDDNEED